MITNKEMVERLKAATVGGRELDEDIAMCLLGAEVEIQHGKKHYYKGNYWISIEPVDCTTTSLDAAMAVIEDKLPRSAIRIQRNLDLTAHWANIQRHKIGTDFSYDWAADGPNCATLPLALCAALFCALAQIAGEFDSESKGDVRDV